MSITPEETIKILTAKAECMRRETSGIDIDCNYRNCDECDLCYKQGTTGDQIEALGVAISALQAQDLQPTCNQLATDTISRKAAIDALCRRCDLAAEDDEPCTEKCNDIKILEKLPSAQTDIIACVNCKHWIRHDRRCGFWNHGVKPLNWCCYAERREE